MIRNRVGLRSLAAALIGLVGAAGPVKADVPQIDTPAYQALRKIGKKKMSGGSSGKQWGRGLRYPLWDFIVRKTDAVLHPKADKLGVFERWQPFRRVVSTGGGVMPHKTPFRAHCSIHGKRFKHLRYRARLWDETSGIVHSFKAKAKGCPICIRTPDAA